MKEVESLKPIMKLEVIKTLMIYKKYHEVSDLVKDAKEVEKYLTE